LDSTIYISAEVFREVVRLNYTEIRTTEARTNTVVGLEVFKLNMISLLSPKLPEKIFALGSSKCGLQATRKMMTQWRVAREQLLKRTIPASD
jgi:hypothetical protein